MWYIRLTSFLTIFRLRCPFITLGALRNNFSISLSNFNFLIRTFALTSGDHLTPWWVKTPDLLTYVDMGVLLESTPLVKIIRKYIQDPTGIFSISSLARMFMRSFQALFRRLYKQLVCIYDELHANCIILPYLAEHVLSYSLMIANGVLSCDPHFPA